MTAIMPILKTGEHCTFYTYIQRKTIYRRDIGKKILANFVHIGNSSIYKFDISLPVDIKPRLENFSSSLR